MSFVMDAQEPLHELLLTRARDAERRAAEAEHLARLGRRMAVFAHESRNILQLMRANLELLRARLDDRPETLEYHARLESAQEHLRRLFDDLRSQAAPLALRRRPCELGELVRRAARRLALASGREIRLSWPDQPPRLWLSLDAPRVEQVFCNLLENSLDARTDPVRVWIDWREARRDGRPVLRLRVRDNGPGVRVEQREKLFEPFHTTKPGGTGLGLMIARRIVEAHGGALELGESTAPGAEFLLTLPLRAESPPPLPSESPISEPART
jgi:signal transduction histidine kinase